MNFCHFFTIEEGLVIRTLSFDHDLWVALFIILFPAARADLSQVKQNRGCASFLTGIKQILKYNLMSRADLDRDGEPEEWIADGSYASASGDSYNSFFIIRSAVRHLKNGPLNVELMAKRRMFWIFLDQPSFQILQMTSTR